MAGIVAGEDIETDHPLLLEIMQLKDDLHEHTLRTEGREVPSATHFVEALARKYALEGKLAAASTGYRRDIDLFFAMTSLGRWFPRERIIARGDFTHAKPHPEAFNLAFATLGLPESARRHIVAFEDDPRGIMAAKAAGRFTCAITTRFPHEKLAAADIAPDLITGSFAEFEQLFEL